MKTILQVIKPYTVRRVFSRSLPALALLLGLSACGEDEYINPGYAGIPYATYELEGQIFGISAATPPDTIPLPGITVNVRNTTKNYESITDESPCVTLTTDSEGTFYYLNERDFPSGTLRVEVEDPSGRYDSAEQDVTMTLDGSRTDDELYYGKASREGVAIYVRPVTITEE